MRTLGGILTALLMLVIAVPAEAASPIILEPALRGEAGITLTWHDGTTALEYQLIRTAADGTTAEFIIEGNHTTYLDNTAGPETYIYQITAIRNNLIPAEDTSNPVPVLEYPWCWPSVVPGDPGVYWEQECYCPPLDPLPPNPPFLC